MASLRLPPWQLFRLEPPLCRSDASDVHEAAHTSGARRQTRYSAGKRVPTLSDRRQHPRRDGRLLCGLWLQVGEYPFSEGGWREEGIPSKMVIRFCERQTESYDRPTACTVFHNGRKLYEHVPENPAHQVVFSAQGARCYFYKGCSPAARAQDLYSPPSITLYACTKVRETFESSMGIRSMNGKHTRSCNPWHVKGSAN